MSPENIIILDCNRLNFDRMATTGNIKNLQVSGLVKVMRDEFDKNYPEPDLGEWDSIFEFMKDLYKKYDSYLILKANKR